MKEILDIKDILFKSRDFNVAIQKVPDKEKIVYFFLNDVKKYLEALNNLKDALNIGKISDGLEKRLFSETNCILRKADSITSPINDRVVVKRIKEMFRRIVGELVYESELVRRAYIKPRGYAGDFETIESIYNNHPSSKGIGLYLEKYFLNDEYLLAVRNRKEMMKKKLADFIIENIMAEIDILNIASGPSREIKELFLVDRFVTDKKINFTLVDQDGDALRFSKVNLDKIPKNINFRFIKENVLNFSSNFNKFAKVLGEFDLIYSIGLADYIPESLLGELIKFCFDLLKIKGKLVIAHKNVKTYKSLAPDWFCDWKFHARDKIDLSSIIEKFLPKDRFEISIGDEQTKHIFFVEITRKSK